jgi:hypothetical protein
MKAWQLIVGGLVAGGLIVVGEAILNLLLLGEEWALLFARLGIAQPTLPVAVQGVAKLLMLGVFAVWLAGHLRYSFHFPYQSGLVAGLIVWVLVWAWVQWGMVLAGYVSLRIAVTTIAWGLWELPLAVGAGTWVAWRLGNSVSLMPNSRGAIT